MFDRKSRYYSLPNLTVTAFDGSEVNYKARRFLPDTADQTVLGQVTVSVNDRWDLIAARIYGDPLKAWQLCDANEILCPLSPLKPGQVLRIVEPKS